MTSQSKFWTVTSIVTVNLGLAVAWYFKSNDIFTNLMGGGEGWIALSLIIPMLHLTALCVIGAFLASRQFNIVAKSFFITGILVLIIEGSFFLIIPYSHGEKLWVDKHEQYKNAVNTADIIFYDQKNCYSALDLYVLASAIKTDEQYPKDQIKKCRQLINDTLLRRHFFDSIQTTKTINTTDSSVHDK